MKDKAIIVEMLLEKAEDYAKTNMELYRLKAIDKGTDLFTSIASRVIIISVIVLFFLLVTLGLCYYMGEVLGKTHLGFFAVAGMYFIVVAILLVFRNAWIDKPLNNFIIRQIFKEKKR